MSGTMGVVAPIPTHASKVHINSFAEDLAGRLNFQPGDAIEPIVARFGGRIVYHNPVVHHGHAPESIRVFSARHFEIYIPSTTSIERDRFTVAHELGHFFLHYPMVSRQNPNVAMVATRWVDETDTTQQRAEWEANWFAAAFLMSSQPFRSEFTRQSGNLRAVAARFCVSVPAAEVRAKNLGLA